MERNEMTNHRMECMKMTANPMQGMEKTNGWASPEGGEVIRYRLEAGEIDWEIAPGRRVRGYGFNGQVPGPTLEAKQGVPLEIEFINRLPEPTVIHWHGLRIPAAVDGTEVVQRPVQPGETFTYRFTPPA